MAKISTRKIVVCALFMALTAVATMVIQIPSPMDGYVNMGDAFVLLCAFTLGPIYGVIAGGVGSMLADLLLGYVIYAPGTLIIKSLVVVVAYFLFKALGKTVKVKTVALIVAGIVAELVMVLGYFFYAMLLMGKGLAAAASIPGNLMQGVAGVIVSTLLFLILDRRNLFDNK
jgi:uncharacterized membrane protein